MSNSTRDIPPNKRIEYINAIWLLENETKGTYTDFGENIGRSRQEIQRFLKPSPSYGISRRMALRIEAGFNKPSGWLSQDHGYPIPRQQQTKPQKKIDNSLGYSNAKTLSQFNDHVEAKSQVAQSVKSSIENFFDEELSGVVQRLTITPFTHTNQDPAINALADSRSLFNMSLRMQDRVVAIERVTIDDITQMNNIKIAMGKQSFFTWHPTLIANGTMDLIIDFDVKGHPKRHLICRNTDPQKLVSTLINQCSDIELFLEEASALTNDVIINWFDNAN